MNPYDWGIYQRERRAFNADYAEYYPHQYLHDEWSSDTMPRSDLQFLGGIAQPRYVATETHFVDPWTDGMHDFWEAPAVPPDLGLPVRQGWSYSGRVRQGVGRRARVGGLTVGAGEIADLNEKYLRLDTDIRAFPQPPMFKEPGSIEGNPAYTEWKEFEAEWNALSLDWARWFNDHQTVLSQTGDDVAAEFAHFQSEYNLMLDRFKTDFGGETKAEKEEPGKGPLDAALGKIPWLPIGIFAAVALGAYIIIPPLIMSRAAR